MKTKAWVLVDYNKLEMWDVELPELQPNQSLVHIHYTSICGSQINEITGKRGEDPYLPHLLGHEAVGVVHKTISGGDKEFDFIKTGDTVICTWLCNEHFRGMALTPPRYKDSNLRELNAGLVTTFSQMAVIDNSRLYPVWGEPCPTLALLGCTIPTGANSIAQYIPLHLDNPRILILGLGGVGMAAAILCRNRRYTKVWGHDINKDKLEYAKSLGVQDAFNFYEKEESSWIDKFDIVLECSGNSACMEAGFRAVKKNGGKLLLAGNAGPGARFSVDAFSFIEGKEIVGIVGGNSGQLGIANMLNIHTQFGPLISKQYEFDELDQAVYDLKTGQIIKPIIKCL